MDHIPVLLEEAIKLLEPSEDKVYVDCTLGAGGHTKLILERCKNCTVIAFEVDPQAISAAKENLFMYERSGRLKIFEKSYTELLSTLNHLNVEAVDGIIADFGVSNIQLSDHSRGFSYKYNSPLDMRMDPKLETNAYDVVNFYPTEKLEEVIKKYGEEPFARRIAKSIVNRRPIRTTGELVEAIARAIPNEVKRKRRRHFATRTFQAIRIEVNKELQNIEALLKQIPGALRIGGRAVFISFHSLEDRIVKNFIKNSPYLRALTKKPITPSETEIKSNPKARSAKLRAAERI